MSEIRANKWSGTGRLTEGPIKTAEGNVHFKLAASKTQDPFHCVCAGKTAENLMQFVKKGDEVTVEGELIYLTFPVVGETLVIEARHIGYGRKAGTVSEGPNT